MEKTLIAFFSATGITAGKAVEIAKITGGDLFEIVPKEKYSTADLDWMKTGNRSTLEMKDLSCRPEMKEKVPDCSKYSRILLGFPIWWYTAPRIINTFLESGDFAVKEIYIFATSGGIGVSKCMADLQQAYPLLHFVKGVLLNRDVEVADMNEWLGK